MDIPNGPMALQALNGIPSGPGAELPLWLMADSMSLRRMRQALACVGSAGRVARALPSGPKGLGEVAAWVPLGARGVAEAVAVLMSWEVAAVVS